MNVTLALALADIVAKDEDEEARRMMKELERCKLVCVVIKYIPVGDE